MRIIALQHISLTALAGVALGCGALWLSMACSSTSVNDGGGTGGAARLPDVHVAGKTGSSQVVKLRDGKRGAIPYQYRDHALFVAFAPYEKPEIAVAVVVEHGEHGGSAAGPIAGRPDRASATIPARLPPVLVGAGCRAYGER